MFGYKKLAKFNEQHNLNKNGLKRLETIYMMSMYSSKSFAKFCPN